MEIAIILLVGLFLLYKTGLMDLTQNLVAEGSTIIQEELDLSAETRQHTNARRIGKLEVKWEDDSKRLGSMKNLKSIKKARLAKQAEEQA